jgi:hypothetical protein
MRAMRDFSMTRRRRKGSAMPVAIDTGTPERAQHGGVVIEGQDGTALDDDGRRVIRARIEAECVVDRYHARMLLTDAQHDAGLRFRRLWRAAALPVAVVASYGDTRGGGGRVDSGTDARAALRSAVLDSGLGRESAAEPLRVLQVETRPYHLEPAGQVVVAVCGLDEWAGGSRRLELLRTGLAALAHYWRIGNGLNTRD